MNISIPKQKEADIVYEVLGGDGYYKFNGPFWASVYMETLKLPLPARLCCSVDGYLPKLSWVIWADQS